MQTDRSKSTKCKINRPSTIPTGVIINTIQRKHTNNVNPTIHGRNIASKISPAKYRPHNIASNISPGKRSIANNMYSTVHCTRNLVCVQHCMQVLYNRQSYICFAVMCTVQSCKMIMKINLRRKQKSIVYVRVLYINFSCIKIHDTRYTKVSCIES